METSPTPVEPTPSGVAFELGVTGIPPRFSQLAHGMIYGLAVPQQGLRLTLIGHTVRRALMSGSHCAVLTNQEPTQFLRKIALSGVSLGPYAKAGLLQVHSQAVGSALGGLVGNRRRLVHDLQALAIPDRSLIVLDGADERLSVSDAGLARSIALALQEWVDAHFHTLIVTFGTSAADALAEPGMTRVAELFAGFASLRHLQGADVLDVSHWFGPLGAMAHASFTLDINEQGEVGARPTFPRNSVDPAQEVKLATRRAVMDFRADDEGWEVADSLLDAVNKGRKMIGGTVLLHFDPQTSLRDLAQAIAVLRGVPRPQLRIVVRECGARLRVPQVAVLLRVGMNLIIPQGVDGAAALAMAESLRGTLSSRITEADVDRLLADVDTPARMLGITEFRASVIDSLQQAQELEVPVCLIRFSVVSQHAMRAVTAALGRARNCLFAEHGGCVWVLLYGCLPERAAGVLARLLGARFESLLEDFQIVGEQGEILRSVRLLETAAVNLADAVFEDTIIRTEVEVKS